MKKAYLAVIAFAVLGALVVAGCGSSNDETTGETSSGGSAESASSGGAYGGGAYGGGGESESASSTASEESGGTTFVSTGKGGDLGQVIVDSEGMTLYDFHKDKGTTSSCYGGCEKAWPPATASGEPTAKGGALHVHRRQETGRGERQRRQGLRRTVVRAAAERRRGSGLSHGR
jgi:hypothetical protein